MYNFSMFIWNTFELLSNTLDVPNLTTISIAFFILIYTDYKSDDIMLYCIGNFVLHFFLLLYYT